MFVSVDNSEDGKIFFKYSLNNKIVQWEFAGNDARKGIIFCLDKLLKKTKKQLSDIDAIGVVGGVGRFTASRISATVANTLAYVLRIPAVALDKDFDFSKFASSFAEKTGPAYILPKYSGEANIGKKK